MNLQKRFSELNVINDDKMQIKAIQKHNVIILKDTCFIRKRTLV